MLWFVEQYWPCVLRTTLILSGVFIAIYCLKNFFSKNKIKDTHFALIFKNLTYFFIIAVAFSMTLSAWGLDITVFLTGFGITGFAVGFALKDIISNFLAGLLVIIYRPIKINDEIKLSGYVGVVKEIDLRYTILETAEEEVLIPNSKVFSEIVVKKKN